MTTKTSSYRQSLLTSLRDPVEASAYLNAALGMKLSIAPNGSPVEMPLASAAK